MKILVSVAPPYRWARLDVPGSVIDHGIAEDIGSIPLPAQYEAVIGVLPIEAVGIVQAELPATSERKAQEIAAYSIEDFIAADIDDVHVSIVDWKSKEESTLAVVDKEQLRSRIEAFEREDIRLDAVYPAQSLMPQHDAVDATVVFLEGGAYVRAKNEFSFLDERLLPTWLEQFGEGTIVAVSEDGHIDPKNHAAEFRLWPVGRHFVDWLGHNSEDLPNQSVLTGEFKPPSKYAKFPGWKHTKMAIAAGLGLAFMPLLFRYSVAVVQEVRVNAKAEAAIESIDETAEMSEDSVGQLRQLVFQSQVNAADYGGYAYVMTRLSGQFPQQEGAITDLDFREGGVTLTVNTESLASVDAIQTALKEDEEIDIEVISQQNIRGKASAIIRIRPRGI